LGGAIRGQSGRVLAAEVVEERLACWYPLNNGCEGGADFLFSRGPRVCWIEQSNPRDPWTCTPFGSVRVSRQN
jgi:hypothetical protein